MKRLLATSFALLAAAILAAGQSFTIKIAEEIPAEAAAVLSQRFTQMLEGEGFTLAEEAEPMNISATVVERMETPGSMSQSVLVLDVKAAACGQEAVFTVRGVGKDEADAWVRAVKQVLPRSKAAKEFLEKLK